MSIDRWYIGNSSDATTTLKVLSYGIEIINNASSGNNSYLQHRVDPKRIELNKVYTLAYCFADGRIIINTLTPDWIKIQIDTWGFVPVSISIDDTTGVTGILKWAALYKGLYTLEDLPPYVPKTYEEELNICKYYFERAYIRAYGDIGDSQVQLERSYDNKRLSYPTISFMATNTENLDFTTQRVWNTAYNFVGGRIGEVINLSAYSHWYGYIDISADL